MVGGGDGDGVEGVGVVVEEVAPVGVAGCVGVVFGGVVEEVLIDVADGDDFGFGV